MPVDNVWLHGLSLVDKAASAEQVHVSLRSRPHPTRSTKDWLASDLLSSLHTKKPLAFAPFFARHADWKDYGKWLRFRSLGWLAILLDREWYMGYRRLWVSILMLQVENEREWIRWFEKTKLNDLRSILALFVHRWEIHICQWLRWLRLRHTPPLWRKNTF